MLVNAFLAMWGIILGESYHLSMVKTICIEYYLHDINDLSNNNLEFYLCEMYWLPKVPNMWYAVFVQ